MKSVTLPDYEKSIIYEDDDIVTIFSPGVSKFLFVTFGDSVSLANGTSFYAEPVVKKLQYTCIGFMAKKRNWYPYESMIKAVNEVKKIASFECKVVIYGGSMGGYAAIKYSSILNADFVLSCCPQWSIDPSECGNQDSGYSKYYLDSLSGMGIKEDDVKGKIFILYDKSHQIDSYHFEMISNKYKNITPINMPFIGHHVTTVIAGTNNVKGIIESIMEADDEKTKKIIDTIRKSSKVRIDRIKRYAYNKFPYLFARNIILKSENSDRVGSDTSRLLSRLIERDSISQVSLLSKIMLRKVSNNRRKALEISISNLNIKSKTNDNLKTFHNTLLSYNPLTSLLSHYDPLSKEIRYGIVNPVSYTIVENQKYLSIQVDDACMFISLSSDGHCVLLDFVEQKDVDDILSVHFHDEGKVTIVKGSVFLSASRNGNCNLSDCMKDWEIFKAI